MIAEAAAFRSGRDLFLHAQAYSAGLQGSWEESSLRKQLYVSRYEALIFSDYHEERWKRAGAPKDSLDLQESLRWMHRSEDLVLEIVKNDQAVFEDLATVRALFPDTPRLRELFNNVYTLNSLWTGEPPHDGSLEKPEQWKKKAQFQLETVADQAYGKPIDDLITFLTQQLPSD